MKQAVSSELEDWGILNPQKARGYRAPLQREWYPKIKNLGHYVHACRSISGRLNKSEEPPQDGRFTLATIHDGRLISMGWNHYAPRIWIGQPIGSKHRNPDSYYEQFRAYWAKVVDRPRIIGSSYNLDPLLVFNLCRAGIPVETVRSRFKYLGENLELMFSDLLERCYCTSWRKRTDVWYRFTNDIRQAESALALIKALQLPLKKGRREVERIAKLRPAFRFWVAAHFHKVHGPVVSRCVELDTEPLPESPARGRVYQAAIAALPSWKASQRMREELQEAGVPAVQWYDSIFDPKRDGRGQVMVSIRQQENILERKIQSTPTILGDHSKLVALQGKLEFLTTLRKLFRYHSNRKGHQLTENFFQTVFSIYGRKRNTFRALLAVAHLLKVFGWSLTHAKPLEDVDRFGLAELLTPTYPEIPSSLLDWASAIALGQNPRDVVNRGIAKEGLTQVTLTRKEAHAYLLVGCPSNIEQWYKGLLDAQYAELLRLKELPRSFKQLPYSRSIEVIKWLHYLRLAGRWSTVLKKYENHRPGEERPQLFCLLDILDEITPEDLVTGKDSVSRVLHRASERLKEAYLNNLKKDKRNLILKEVLWESSLPTYCKILRTPAQVVKEGKEQGHCVGGYVESIEKGRLLILSVRSHHGRSTVEIAPNGRSIRQHKGHSNGKAPKRHITLMEAWLQRNPKRDKSRKRRNS